MLGSLHSMEILEEKAKLIDKLNQAELELFEAERQLVHCDSELGEKLSVLLPNFEIMFYVLHSSHGHLIAGMATNMCLVVPTTITNF